MFSALRFICLIALCFSVQAAAPPAPAGPVVSLFDGKTLAGWEGDSNMWSVRDGAITGGTLEKTISKNNFLCTTRQFTNFVLRFNFKLTGTEGFVNSGMQIRSQRVPNHHEVSGYQCDIGDPDWWGAIYDEARRNKVMFPTDMAALNPKLKRGDWNTYIIRADGPRVTTWINGVQLADYYEEDASIPDYGILGIQIHSGGKAVVQVQNITIEELPKSVARFIGAPAPKKNVTSPLAPSEQQASFTLPPGFEIELVASEEQGVKKPITVVWDSAGRMWTMTALEYPVDANDNKELAAALYQQPRSDKVLVFDTPFGDGVQTPRVFADGLAIPLGLLPYKNGAFVQHGSNIVFVSDTDADGKADKREVILTGFGIGDSHLMPHQFTRAPGNMILIAQGAFNYSKVKTKTGELVDFNQTLLGRFSPNGRKFETIGYGPCNIWGLVLNQQGEVFIQEANDFGYPVMPFHAGACYPGCTPFPKPYAPTFPNLAKLGMGGTGLSGLALSDRSGAYPPAYSDVFYVANPITRTIQAVKLHRDGGYYDLVKLPDFIKSSDEWFRPVAIQFGPDGCLYIVDWYNKVISHNEIPRNHPDRDKQRGRIWRVYNKDIGKRKVPNLQKGPDAELVKLLGNESILQSHLAWQELIDRNATNAISELRSILENGSENARCQALWVLESLKAISAKELQKLAQDPNPNLRREAIRVLGKFTDEDLLPATTLAVNDADPEVRAEVIRQLANRTSRPAFTALLSLAKPPLDYPVQRSSHSGKTIKTREAYSREFERYLIRRAFENQKDYVKELLAKPDDKLDKEALLLAALSLDSRDSARIIARILPALGRPVDDEALLKLFSYPGEPAVGEAITKLLQTEQSRQRTVEILVTGRTRLKNPEALKPVLSLCASKLLDGNDAEQLLALKLVSGFELFQAEPVIARYMLNPDLAKDKIVAVLNTLAEIRSGQLGMFEHYALQGETRSIKEAAAIALAVSANPDGPKKLLAMWNKLTPRQKQLGLDRLVNSASSAEQLLASVNSDAIPATELDNATIEKMAIHLHGKSEFEDFLKKAGRAAASVLRLDGKKESYIDSNITLTGPFTVETWIRLDPGISNEDGILGRPGGADLNFADGKFRLYGGPKSGDRIIAKRRMTAELWSHVALTRGAEGKFKIYIDGELDTEDSKPLKESFDNLDIGRVSPPRGTAGYLTEYRVWNICRSPEQIRAYFDQAIEKEVLGLLHRFAGAGPWGKLNGNAKVVTTIDPPPLMTADQAAELDSKMHKYTRLASDGKVTPKGKELAETICLACHAIQGKGAMIGPNLSGAGAMSKEGLLRSILTPNAAMEAGYRIFRLESVDGEITDGFLISQDAQSYLIRIPNSEDRRIPKSEVKRAYFVRRSLMPEGLLEGMPDSDAAELLAYLKSLK